MKAKQVPSKKASKSSSVICDICKVDYTRKSEVGGFIIGETLICPKCSVGLLPVLKQYKMAKHISTAGKLRESFSTFVHKQRSLV